MPLPPSAPRPLGVVTPLTWAGGVVLLGVAVWLPGIIAIFRAFFALFG